MDNQEVKYNLPNEEEQKKKNRRITGIFVLLTSITLDICALLAYIATIQDKKRREQYVVSEESITIHNNLLTFIKTICEDDSHPVPNQIIGINYQDDKLLISSKNDSNEIYVTYDHTGGLEETLPEYIIKENNLLDINSATNRIHFPKSFEDFENARKRFAFEELLTMQLLLLNLKNKCNNQNNGSVH